MIDEKTLKFYRRVIFKTLYKENYKTKDKRYKNIFNCCFANSWNTMARTFTGAGHGRGKKIKDNLKNKLIYYMTNNIIDTNNKINPKDFINPKSEINNNKTNTIYLESNDLQLKIGQVQKVVNMFFKYIYTFKEELKLKKEQFENCDCVIDKNNIKRLNNDLKDLNKTFDLNVSWSQIKSFDTYTNFQTLVDEVVMNNKNKYKSRFDYEMDWE